MSASPATFMGAPYAVEVPEGSRAVIAGLPLDAGRHPTRVGARLGPRAVREQSLLLGPIDPLTDVDVPKALDLVDVGDFAIDHFDVEAAQRSITPFVRSLLATGATPITIGGDGTVTLPQLRALAERHPGLAVVHLDAHTDAYLLEGDAGSVAFTRAAEQGLIDASRSFHIGLRGPVGQHGLYKRAHELGYRLVTMDELLARGLPELLGRLADSLAGRPVYVCWDMDVFDPSVAPGVFTPSWGGLTAREGLAIAAAVSRLDVVAVDVNTVSPLHDAAGLSAFLAARLIFEFLNGLAGKPATKPNDRRAPA